MSQDLDVYPDKDLLAGALRERHGDLSLEERARILQMIMQSSLSYMRQLCQPPDVSRVLAIEEHRSPCQTILDLMEAIDRNTDSLYPVIIEQRMLYIQLAKTYINQVHQERERMQKERVMRRRISAGGEVLTPISESGKKAETRVVDRLMNELGTKVCKGRLTTCVRLGSNLNYLASRLGLGVWLTFPADVARLCDFQLTFPSSSNSFPSLVKSIEPSM